ncbi:class I SAM-dependent methyltransferase [Maritalea mediterranea]|uniref:Class I SAM-dependent methyltransferase n=1 Tax=Maritalea mediterranea TaxID=2909667 RepID=A0ABS9E9D1_9HYPH|nr:class I SAM-dependent methyltransferase [Maritalea mediterranea]MCF4099491.1 class I SAM-dependent methyltransferase [Maritalea mediterranea]
MTATDFDKLAKIYDAEKISPWNDLYERPNSTELMGDVNGLTVLDAGCGGGKHCADLLAKGAKMHGFDLSEKMLAIAKDMLGDQINFKTANLAEKLPYQDAQFDRILCALAMHYVKDWTTPLSEFYRLLKPGGKVVISTHHPFMDHALAGGEDYFAHTLIEDSWKKPDGTLYVRYWRRPLTQMIEEIKNAGLEIDLIKEPMPLPETQKQFPDAYQKLTTQPRFIFLVLKKPD